MIKAAAPARRVLTRSQLFNRCGVEDVFDSAANALGSHGNFGPNRIQNRDDIVGVDLVDGLFPDVRRMGLQRIAPDGLGLFVLPFMFVGFNIFRRHIAEGFRLGFRSLEISLFPRINPLATSFRADDAFSLASAKPMAFSEPRPISRCLPLRV